MGMLRVLHLDRLRADGSKSSHRAIFLELLGRSVKHGAKCEKVLDLGSALQANVEQLSHFARKIHFEDINSSAERPARGKSSEQKVDVTALNLAEGGDKYDLILVWDLLNYLTPHEIKELSRQLSAVAHPGTMLVAYLRTKESLSSKPLKIRILPEHRVEFEIAQCSARPAPRFSKSQLRALLPGFKRSRSIMLTNGYEEQVFVGK